MAEELKSVTSSEGTGKNKIEKRISVEEISNGYIITESKEYQDKKGDWKYETTKVYSKTNPLAEATSLKTLLKKSLPGS